MLFLPVLETIVTRRVNWGARHLGEYGMLRTISLGTCVSVQGPMVSQLADGKIVVRVDGKNFVGYPVTAPRKN